MRLLHLRIFDELSSNEMDNTVLANPLFMIAKREKIWDVDVFKAFWINLPRYVAVFLYDEF